jgi:replicative DNA helicase
MTNVLEGLMYLSESSNQEENYKLLKEKVVFLYGVEKEQVQYYIEVYNNTGAFPAFTSTIKQFAILDEVIVTANSYERLVSYLNRQEWKSLKERMLSTSDKETEEKLLSEMEKLFRSSQSNTRIEVINVKDIDIKPFLDRSELEGIKIPIQQVAEEFGKLQKGLVAGFLASPGHGKTTLAINTCYHNSFLDNQNGLYFYLEDIDRRYKYQLLSRRSFDTGERIPAKLMKQGFVDEESKAKFLDCEARYNKEQTGNIYFVGMQNFSNDPYLFSMQFAHLLKEYNIDYFVFDYLQKMKFFMPGRWDELKYLNAMGSALSLVALGAINGHRTAGIVLSQLNKEGEKKAERTKGKISLHDAAECSCIERDFQLVLHTFIDPAMAETGEMTFQMLKNRDSALDTNPRFTSCDLAYAYIGEMAGSKDVYSEDTLTALSSGWETLF